MAYITDEQKEKIRNWHESLSEDLQDMIDHPEHYKTDKYECIDVMLDIFGPEATMNFCMCNAFKYVWRASKKNGQEDVDKARWYLDKYTSIKEDYHVNG